MSFLGPFIACMHVIKQAYGNGHIHVLEWFKNSGFEFKYDKNIIKRIKTYRDSVLEWFKNSGFE